VGETMTADIEPHYDTADVARQCGIQRRQAIKICRDVLGARTRYRLTREEFEKVVARHRRDGRPTRQKSDNTFSVISTV